MVYMHTWYHSKLDYDYFGRHSFTIMDKRTLHTNTDSFAFT